MAFLVRSIQIHDWDLPLVNYRTETNKRLFIALQSYILSAADLPQSDAKFEEQMAVDKCKRLTEIDSEIYGVSSDHYSYT
jgi:hypothetical protein